MSELDARLVERAKGGDAFAFDSLVRRHIRTARGVALAVTADAHDADDVCQEAFITALERIEQCRDPAKFAPWLMRIVRNSALNRIRYERARPTRSMVEAARAPDRSDPGRDLDRAELRRDLREALETLTEVQREVVLLHDLEGWRHAEIAELLGLAEGTSRYHLFRARAALREMLEPLRTEERSG